MKNFVFPFRRLSLTTAVIVGLFCASPATLFATGYTVNDVTDTRPTLGGAGTGTAGDLRYCITQAGYGATGSTHTISFVVTGTITLADHELVINSNLTINGPGAASLTVDANHASRVLFVVSSHTVALSGLTLTNGTGVGNDPTGFDNGNLDGDGGAILNDRSVLALNDCTVSGSGNTNLGGGGIYNRAQGADATLALNNCTISGNSAGSFSNGGGGLLNYSNGGVATLSITGCSITGNSASGSSGGGITNLGASSSFAANLAVSQSTITANTSNSSGGGIYDSGNSFVSLTDSIISGNSASSLGGGIHNFGTSLTLLNCSVNTNTAANGGGLTNYGDGGTPQLTVSNCTLMGNMATTSGGGIYNYGSFGGKGTVTVANSTLNANTAQQRGGGIYNYSSSGGVVVTLNVANSTICANTTQQRGGGIANYANGGTAAAVIANSTICGNSALSGGAGIANDQQQGTAIAATVTLGNTILALHPTGANFGAAYGTGVSSGFNLSDDATGTAFLSTTGDLNNTPSGLQVDGGGLPLLQDNGGSTETVALLAGSAAIDAGKTASNPLTGMPTLTDQRGLVRPYVATGVTPPSGGDASDIGAFESGSHAPSAPAVASAATATGQAAVAFAYQISAINGPVSYGAANLPTGLVLNPATGIISGTPSTAGQFTVTVSATNAGGTGTGTLTLNIQPAGPAPVITSATTATGQVGTAFNYLITGTHSPNSFNATSLPAGLSVNTTTGLISGTPTAAGFSNVILTARNSSGIGSGTLSLTIQSSNPSAPVITSATTATGQAGAVFTYQITATNSPTAYNATGLPTGIGVNTTTGVISGTPTAAGTFNVTLSATNASGTASIILALSVETAGANPVITSPTTAAGQVGVVFTYQIIATNNPQSFRADSLPTGLTVNTATGLISGVPTVSGLFAVTLTAINSASQGTVTLALNIQPAAPAPVIISPLSASGQVGVTLTYQITATNNPTAFNATGLPKGLGIDPATGLISGKPMQAGTTAITISGTNASGTGSAVITLTVTVPAAAREPNIALTSPPNNLTVVAGTAVPLSATVTDPDGILAQVQFFLNGQLVTTLVPPGPYTALARPTAAGACTLMAVATDALGRTTSSAVTINAATYNAANPPPTGSLLTPIANRLLPTGGTVSLTVTATAPTPGGLDRVVIYADGAAVATFDGAGHLLALAHPGVGHAVRQDEATPLNGLFTTTYQLPGIDKIIAVLVAATDKLGQTTFSDLATFRTVTTSDRAPLVSFRNLTSPVPVPVGQLIEADVDASDPNSVGASSTIHPRPVRQDAPGDAILAQLEYFLNGKSIGQALTPPYSFSFTPTAAGKYVLHVVATDGSGLSTVSDPVVVRASAGTSVVSVAAGNDGLAVEGGAKGIVTISRTGDTDASLTVAYKVKGAAKAGVDYKPLSGTVTIPAGAVKVKVKIKTIDNHVADGARVLKVKLSPSSHGDYVLGNPSTTKVKILDND